MIRDGSPSRTRVPAASSRGPTRAAMGRAPTGASLAARSRRSVVRGRDGDVLSEASLEVLEQELLVEWARDEMSSDAPRAPRGISNFHCCWGRRPRHTRRHAGRGARADCLAVERLDAFAAGADARGGPPVGRGGRDHLLVNVNSTAKRRVLTAANEGRPYVPGLRRVRGRIVRSANEPPVDGVLPGDPFQVRAYKGQGTTHVTRSENSASVLVFIHARR